jgi:hypothetical protein
VPIKRRREMPKDTKEFNYKGVLFDAEFDTDSDGHSMIIMSVHHKLEDITECLNPDLILDMEMSLNEQLEEERAIAEKEARE